MLASPLLILSIENLDDMEIGDGWDRVKSAGGGKGR